MAEMSRRFNFDDFDALIAEALDEHRSQDSKMAQEDADREEQQRWAAHDKVPGQIGGVAIRRSFQYPDVIEIPRDA